MPRLLDEVRAVARMQHLSLRTERAYIAWIKRYIFFHNKRHPLEMRENEIRQFISHLAVEGGISASTQTVALSALLFLYRDVLKQELPYVRILNVPESLSGCQPSSLAKRQNASSRTWKALID